MRGYLLIKLAVVVCLLAGCSEFSRKTSIIEHSPPDWDLDQQGFKDVGCEGQLLTDSCAELIALGCDVIVPSDRFGGLEPSHAVMICIHENGKPLNMEHFKQGAGLDTRYRSTVIFQEHKYRLISSETDFQAIFAPIESTDEALSYALSVTSFSARYDLGGQTNREYLVDVIEESHAEETQDGFLVQLFDGDHIMGCGNHSAYAVKVLVTRDGEVHEVERREIYKEYACYDF